MRKIVRIKEERLGGHILALYDLDGKIYVGGEYFVLPGKDDIVAKQLAAILGDFGRDIFVVGVMQDLRDLCARYGVAVSSKWRIYGAPRK